jgi:hypothetical protein
MEMEDMEVSYAWRRFIHAHYNTVKWGYINKTFSLLEFIYKKHMVYTLSRAYDNHKVTLTRVLLKYNRTDELEYLNTFINTEHNYHRIDNIYLNRLIDMYVRNMK